MLWRPLCSRSPPVPPSFALLLLPHSSSPLSPVPPMGPGSPLRPSYYSCGMPPPVPLTSLPSVGLLSPSLFFSATLLVLVGLSPSSSFLACFFASLCPLPSVAVLACPVPSIFFPVISVSVRRAVPPVLRHSGHLLLLIRYQEVQSYISTLVRFPLTSRRGRPVILM